MTAKQKKAKGKGELGNEQYPLIQTDRIIIVDRPDPTTESDDKLFFNPRSLESFTADEMAEMRESLREDGLQCPPIVRVFTEGAKEDGDITKIELIAGERRLRSIQGLIEDAVMCVTDDGEKPAGEVFKSIPCKVYYNISDEKALRIAFIENGQREPLQVRDEIALVERLSKRNLKQDEIASLLGTNVTWVSQTSNFREELPPEAFDKLLTNKLSRHVAVKMLSYKKEDRDKLYQEMVQVEKEEREAAQSKIREEKAVAEDDEDIASLSEQEAIDAANPVEAKRSSKRKSQAQRKQKELAEREAKLEKDKETLRQGTLQRAGQRTNINPKKAQILTKTMIEQFYVDLPSKWKENGKIDAITKQAIPEEMLDMVMHVAKSILTGQHDSGKTIRQIMVSRGLWTLPEGYTEEPDAPLEIPEGDEELGE